MKSKGWWSKLLLWLAGTLLLLVALLYAEDYGRVRYRLFRQQEVFDTVAVTPLYVIHEKGVKLEYQLAPPQNETCVRSLFPHLGFNPCWYVRQHTERRIDI